MNRKRHLILFFVASMALVVTHADAADVSFTVEAMVNPLNTLDPVAGQQIVPDAFIEETFVRNDGTILGAMNVAGDIDFFSQRIVNGVAFLPSAISTSASIAYTSGNTGGIYDSGITIAYQSFSDLAAGDSFAATTGATPFGFDPTAGMDADFRRMMQSQVRSGRGEPGHAELVGKTDITVSGLTSGTSYRVQLLLGTNPAEDRTAKIVQDTTETTVFTIGWTAVTAACASTASCGPVPDDGNSVSVLAEFVADANSIDFVLQPTNGQRAYLNAIAVAQIPDVVTLLGDYNDTGVVEQGDLDLVLLNWGATWPPEINGWINQQPTDDGLVDQNDLDGVLLHWGDSTVAAASPVPEPGSAVLGIVGSIALLLRRRF